MNKDCKSVWENCLKTIRSSLPEHTFNTWFVPIVPLSLHNNTLTIQVPSPFYYEYIEENYLEILRKAIDKELGPEGKLEYSVVVDKGNAQSLPKTMTVPNTKIELDIKPLENKTNPDLQKRKMQILKEYESFFRDIQFNENYTFDNFVEGDCNRLARAAGLAVAKKPGVTAFNPLMLYGGVGLGKTHLVQAIANHVRFNSPEKIVVYVSSEKFVNQFIDEIKNDKIQKLTNFYLQIDVLIIDDVQFLAGKVKTQEMFFHIFNHLHQHGKQIIMTSDRPPKELQGLEDRLLSRFKWGLTADLQQPDFETRVAIILKKLQNEGIEISYDVVEYLAHNIDSNIRELEGVIVSLLARSNLERREIDLQLARETIKHIIQKVDERRPETADVDIENIQKAVCQYFNVKEEDIKGKSRTQNIVKARQIAMYLCKEYTELSLKAIGYHFGGRDHSTVIHAIQTISDLIEVDSSVRQDVNALMKIIGKNE
ncbi:chromosomal replication initiator protein DnaA [Raineya orbicola]|uniref:Chromosomal replication initiator protein DnaA n=1 Tax=Raineya orbicola TaxID=2016530 RepID=A0A2N3IJA5_9BACT|nr:chromosomal replication initiator protein DnaA [Raineya orbicola]PKQ70313.1 DnaA: chromosomal replication initiator protein DnaA [Raineya orbicola]